MGPEEGSTFTAPHGETRSLLPELRLRPKNTNATPGVTEMAHGLERGLEHSVPV